MEYKDIEIFLNLVRTRNITKTAQEMYVSQSTVSTRLKNLEEEIGCQLIKRGKGLKQLHLTRQGEDFIYTAERWQNLFQETFLLKDRALHLLRFASNESTFYELLLPFVYQFNNEHPDIQLSIQICNSSDVYRLVENNLIDFGFAAYESLRSDIDITCINSQKYCIAYYSGEEGTYSDIDIESLDPAMEIRLTGGHYAALNSWREKHISLQNSYKIEIDSVKAAAFFLQQPGCWCLCPKKCAEYLFADIPLQYLELEDEPEERKIYLVKNKNNIGLNQSPSNFFEEELYKHLEKLYS